MEHNIGWSGLKDQCRSASRYMREVKMKRHTLAAAVLLAAFLGLLVGCADTGKKCFGYGTSVSDEKPLLGVENRFAHCSKGDVIDVYSKALTTAFGKPKSESVVTELTNFALRANEVAEYCDFSKPIVFLGKTNAGLGVVPDDQVHWFACVYIGKKRESVLAKN
jgi:hypothetical protein